MNHPTHEEWMAYIYGELDAKKGAALKEHLEQCPNCQRDIAVWRGVMAELDAWKLPKMHRAASRFRQGACAIARWAVAALILIAAGYIAGRASAPQAMDKEELRLALERNNIRLKDELRGEFLKELDEYSIKTLAASSAMANQLLAELIQSINAAEYEKRRELVQALWRMELNRLEDDARLGNGVAALAVLTGDELMRTKQDMALLWADYVEFRGLIPNSFEIEDTSEEGGEE